MFGNTDGLNSLLRTSSVLELTSGDVLILEQGYHNISPAVVARMTSGDFPHSQVVQVVLTRTLFPVGGDGSFLC